MLPYLNVAILYAIPTGIAFWLYRKWVQGKFYAKDIRIEGKVVIITGANSGIGKETAIDLARRGARVYIACRSVERGEAAKKEIVYKAQSHNVLLRQLDLASMKSIRAFVERFRREERHLDILINNAAVVACPQSETEDGFETQFGVNHLGHFLLTHLLTDMLIKSTQARIINVSSNAHFEGTINQDDLMLKSNYDPLVAYKQSKLANVLFTRELANRHQRLEVSAYSLHPGCINTKAWNNMQNNLKMFKPLGKLAALLFLRTPKVYILFIY